MIDCRAVAKSYGDLKVIDGLSLRILERGVVAILGRSGCGKSTLFRMIAGLEGCSGGSIRVAGMIPDEARRGRAIGLGFQAPVLLPWRTVLENVLLPVEIRAASPVDPVDLLRRAGLEGFESFYPDRISLGMQQRVALVRALVFRPRVLLLDEPTAALDEITRDELHEVLLELWPAAGVTVLIVTHSLEEAIYLADSCLVLTPRPARVAGSLEVPLPRPREPQMRFTAEFRESLRCLREMIGRA
jgi:NitT/TauT family transport system ATP-binding protein